MSHNVGADTTASPIKFLVSSELFPLPSWRVFLFSAHWWFLMITGFSSIYCKWKVAQLTGIWVSQGKLRQMKSTSASPVCPAAESCCVCGLSGLLTLKTFLFCSLLPLQYCVYTGVCVYVHPSRSAAAASGNSQGKTCCWGAESCKEPLLSAGSRAVSGRVQPRCVPPALISQGRVKCHSLGVFFMVVQSVWELKGGSGR